MIPHKKYLEMAIKLAEKGRGKVSPNPLVGCLIIKRGRIVGRGYHKKAGDHHAEVNALKEAGKKAKDSILYCTLEPCSHWGKTPPCTEQIVQSGVREIVIGNKDPNPMVNGFEELKGRGIKSRIGILDEECAKLNEVYLKWMKTKKPFVIVKAAMSLDGKIATKSGDSKYISGKEARKIVHELRSDLDAVMVGSNTVKKDNPELTVRLTRGENPIKIVIDSKLKISEKAKIVKKEPGKLIIITSKTANKKKVKALQLKGVRFIHTNLNRGKIDLKEAMKELGKHDITSIMIEGGAVLNAEAIRAGIVDKMLFFISPKMIGQGPAAVGDLGITQVDKALKLKNIDFKKIGKDILVEGYL
jgi:diaminohydroxyphosphoribosylaminopyrimidine deaminase/5-amino-6-(5-phosphoribosylamino)uracil reductase|tara:strand:- start:59 stop:1132 length:1074 start_codon:yes stop_codon:yes gene_type:complete